MTPPPAVPSDCSAPLEIQVSGRECDRDGIVLEKGWSPHFYPTDVATPDFYFALALGRAARR